MGEPVDQNKLAWARGLERAFLVVVLCATAVGCGSGDEGADGSPDGRTARDGAVDSATDGPDGTVLAPDASVDATSSNKDCTNHHECEQREFCHRGTCRLDAQAVYHCGKTGCPPGHWCVEPDGRRATCAPDDTYRCDDACDCGPAHCCVENRCVSDVGDFWIGSGDPADSSVCSGQATYCRDAPECMAAFAAWERQAPGRFLAWDTRSGQSLGTCTDQSCYGTACNCGEPGQACIDVVSEDLPKGAVCGVLSGGTCVSHALAESVYEWSPRELLECCEASTANGERCDAGWVHHGNRVGYRRIEATVAEDCSCGDGQCCPEEVATCLQDCAPEVCEGDACLIERCDTEGNQNCDPGESANTCSRDCAEGCGDGLCAYHETAETCAADCLIDCGDGWCTDAEAKAAEPCESDCSEVRRCEDTSIYRHVSAVCGDGVCAQKNGCQLEQTESCKTCPSDCGVCAWEADGQYGNPSRTAYFEGVWAHRKDDVFVVGRNGAIVRFDGDAWRPQEAPTLSNLNAVWGRAHDEVYAVGNAGTIVHFDGKRWRVVESNTQVNLRRVWGAGPRDVYAVGNNGTVLRFDGSTWAAEVIDTDADLRAVWGSSADDVFVAGDAGVTLHYDGKDWQPMDVGATGILYDIWGSGPDDVYMTASGFFVYHYDGSTWTQEPTAMRLRQLWGSGPDNIFGAGSDLGRFDGTSWKAMTSAQSFITDISGSSATHAVAVGMDGNIQAFDGSSWSTAPVEEAQDLGDVRGLEDGSALAVGLRDTMLHFEAGRWQQLSSWPPESAPPGGASLTAVWAERLDRVFAAGNRAAVYAFDGQDWSLSMMPTVTMSLGGMDGSSASNIFVAANQIVDGQVKGRPFHYDGTAWELLPGDFRTFSDVWVSPSGRAFFVGNDDDIWAYDGSNWQSSTLSPIAFNAISGTNDDNIVVAALANVTWHFDGETWQSRNTGVSQNLNDLWASEVHGTYGVGNRATVVRYDGQAWLRVPLDIRQPGTLQCPDLIAVHGSDAGGPVAVGTNGLRVRPKAISP